MYSTWRFAGRLVKCSNLLSAGNSIAMPVRVILAEISHVRFARTLRPIAQRTQSGSKNIRGKSAVDAQLNAVDSERNSDSDYNYFRKIAAAVNAIDMRQQAVTQLDVNIDEDTATSKPLSKTVLDNTKTAKTKFPGGDLDVSSIVPALPTKSFNLAAYVNDSETLSNLVKLGVDLSKVEKNPSVADKLVKMDFDRDVKPVLLFLHKIGVSDDDVGKCLTKAPGILCEALDDMQARINYLESKAFSKEAIGKIIANQTAILLMPTKQTDAQLGYLQRDFMLNGDEVRQVVTRFPKIVIWSKASIKDVKLKLKEFLGFSEVELKQMLLACPKLYTSDKHAVAKRFDYLHNIIGFSHDDIVRWPLVLRARTQIIRQRHEFLKLLRRDNFDSTSENYVSPKALSIGRDVEFCENVAKVSVKQFNNFLKTL